LTPVQIPTQALRRLNPHRGLVIDVSTWSAAHDYHRMHHRLHNIAMHRPGVAVGLEVVAWNPPDQSVVIYPGVAIDTQGNIIIVGESVHFRLNAVDPGLSYLTLMYRDVPEATAQPGGPEGATPTYVVERYLLQQLNQIPNEAYVELARIDFSSPQAVIRDAQSILRPGPDEIDLRYRLVSGPPALGQVAIGVISLETGAGGAPRHQPGAIRLAHAINATTGYRAEFKGAVGLDQEVGNFQLLLMAGQQEFVLSQAQLAVLDHFLQRGGTIMGESCGAGTGVGSGQRTGAFYASFNQMAGELQRQMTPVQLGDPLLTVHHLFSQAPDGTEGPPRFLVGDGILFSDGDFGCLWDGGWPERPAAREAIRSATELGVNLGVYGAQRGHHHYLKSFAQ
jgi:hypothetical protein